MRPACALNHSAPAAYDARNGRIRPAADLEVSCSLIRSRARRTVGEVVWGALRLSRRPGCPRAPAFADRGLGHYAQRNLVSDVPGAAELTDPNLVNAWGLSFGPTTPAWVADNGTDVSTLYSGAVGGIAGGEGAVDGLDPGRGADRHGLQRRDRVRRALRHELRPGALPVLLRGGDDHGLEPGRPAAADVDAGADGRHRAGRDLQGARDRRHGDRPADLRDRLPQRRGRRLGRELRAGASARARSPTRRSRPATRRSASRRSPAGSSSPTPSRTPTPRTKSPVPARASSTSTTRAASCCAASPRADRSTRRGASRWRRRASARASGALLIGNFGDGRINAYDPVGGRFLGALRGEHGRPIAIDGLWALEFGNGVIGTPQTLLFTAGPGEESHGLFGELTPIPGTTARRTTDTPGAHGRAAAGALSSRGCGLCVTGQARTGRRRRPGCGRGSCRCRAAR